MDRLFAWYENIHRPAWWILERHFLPCKKYLLKYQSTLIDNSSLKAANRCTISILHLIGSWKVFDLYVATMEYLRTSKMLFSITRIRKIVAFVQYRYCSNVALTTANSRETPATAEKFKSSRIPSGPTFQDFIKGVSVNKTSVENSEDHDQHTYFSEAMDMGNFRKGSPPQLIFKHDPSGIKS